MSAYFEKKKVRPYRQQEIEYGFLDAIEGLIYELKPMAYLIFAITVFRSKLALNINIKALALGIAIYSIYLIINRLFSRGYL